MKAKDRKEKEQLIIDFLGERPKNIQSWTDLQIIQMSNQVIQKKNLMKK